MKVAKIFWRNAPLKKGVGLTPNKRMMLGVDRRIWLNPFGALAEANFLLVEYPMVFNLPVPIVDTIFTPPNNRTWLPVLYTFASPGVEFHMAKRKDVNVLSFHKTNNKNLVFRCLIYDPAPRWMEVLIERSRRHYDPLMDTDSVRALKKSVAFITYEDFLDKFAP
jgi:hypothetical protein